MAGVVRAFLALEIPESVKERIARSRDPLRARLPKARWVRPEGQHLTIKFLGEVERERIDALASRLAPEIEGLGSVRVEFSSSGFFPSNRRPRVAWIGGTANGVEPLVAAVERVAEAHGFERERRSWSLHLTQARLNRPWPPDAVDAFLAWGRELELEPFECSELVVFRSRLEPGGAVYTALERMQLD
jgi:2'-5' RNA ligase